jgi:putative redox protein
MSDPDTHRSVELDRTGFTDFRAVNARGGELVMGEGEDERFTPVELLLAAIAGCSALDVDHITHKRAEALSFEVTSSGKKVRDEQGNHLTDLRLTFRVRFPEGPEGDAARQVLPTAVARSHDRLCTVSRTVQLGAAVTMEIDQP